MMHVRSASLVGLLIAASIPARAAAPSDALAGDRSFAMGGAHRGLGTSNDTIFLNPAGMAAVHRYDIDIDYGKTGADDQQYFNCSVVDSKSGPVAGAIAFGHEGSGIFSGGISHLYLGAAYAISEAIAFGFNLHNMRGGYDDFANNHHGVNAYAGDVGLMLTLTDGFSLGASFQNAWRTGDALSKARLPPILGFGTGLSFGLVSFAADIAFATGDNPNENGGTSYHVGAEYFAASTVPVRLGFSRQRVVESDNSVLLISTPYRNYLSGGLGWAAPGGAIEFSYRRSLQDGKDWGVVGALKLFI